mmetsp:Transcript_275/g.386  ORF Transcript_275/g.386 Transcript_275/m.386 type:complete len:512 (-) Transcript_275:326-1861(-)
MLRSNTKLLQLPFRRFWSNATGNSRRQHRLAHNQHQHPSSLTHNRCMSTKNHEIIQMLPPRFLRQSSTQNYDQSTHQRLDVHFDINNGKPPSQPVEKTNTHNNDYYSIRHCMFDDAENKWIVTWNDDEISTFSNDWINEQIQKWTGRQPQNNESYDAGVVKRVHWANLTETHVRASNSPLSLSFSGVVSGSGEQQAAALRILYRYGILLVTNTPTDDGGEGVAALAASVSGGSNKKDCVDTSLLGWYQQQQKQGGKEQTEGRPVTVLRDGTDGPLRTMFGNVWSTHSSDMAAGASIADSAYGNGALPLHTDMTYFRDPPGLQIFTMVSPAAEGGKSIFADGFAAAERLRIADPTSFNVLCTTVRRYRSIDDATGWHLEARGPVISAVNRKNKEHLWGPVTAIRHNDLDRLPDLPPPPSCGTFDTTWKKEQEEFYEKLQIAHSKWDEILGSDEFRLVMDLQPGDTVLVANQRCLHGRTSFSTFEGSRRAVMGCYVSQDELDSRFRRAGFQLH